jgi:hypothetical protein
VGLRDADVVKHRDGVASHIGQVVAVPAGATQRAA